MFLIVISHVVFIRPHHYMSVTFMAGMAGVDTVAHHPAALVRAAPLLTLDWRIAKLPQPIRQI